MNRRIIFSVLIFFFATSMFAQDKVVPQNRMDSVSYAIGVSMYEGSLQFRIKLNYEMVAAALIATADSNAIMNSEQAVEYISRVHQQVKNADTQKNLELGKKFLEENKKVDGINVTQSGLQYRVIRKGTGTVPTDNDRVKVNYTGYLLDGTKFDSSVDRGQPAVFGVTSVIPGWTEVLKLMPEGSEYVVYIPAQLAYGERQMGKDITAGSTLIFEIQLIEVMSK